MWNLLVEPQGRSGPENMARDEALLDEADRTGAAFLRLYRWDPPCLSLGRNEPDPDRADRRDIAVVRRPTGGRSVWHEHEVTYAVAAPIATFGSLREAYCAIHTRLATALRFLGAEVSLAPHRPTARLSDRPRSCFAAPVGGEIVARGRKLVGSAQVRRGAAFLQHGSVLLDGSQEKAAVRGEPYAVRGDVTLREVLGHPVAFDDVTAAIVAHWGEPLRPSDRPPAASFRVRPSAHLAPLAVT
jgi:lipoyl(octanoyl) transferase